jgi:hypothetical protein
LACLEACNDAEHNCNEAGSEDEPLKVQCDFSGCRSECRAGLDKAFSRCDNDQTNCANFCRFSPRQCPCGGCASGIN